MEGGIEGFFNTDFDLLGMSFQEEGNEGEGTCASFSWYAAGDYDWTNVGADFEVPAAVARVSLPGVYEDYSYRSSLVNVVDPTLQWNGSCCVPAADFSGIQNEIITGNSQVPTSDQVLPTEENFAAEKGPKRKRKSHRSEDTEEIVEKPKKRPRQYRVSLQKQQENNKTGKRKRLTNVLGKEVRDNDKNGDCDDNVIGRQEGQSSLRACSSEVDLDSQLLSNSNGMKDSSADENPSAAEVKPRASKAAATDPQSLYARRRREKINERLKILQNLIPNGTKVDISTMLEEAVHYVKFLQVQIKLLSSDDLWMYAPIAYNGKDIGLDMNQLFPSGS